MSRKYTRILLGAVIVGLMVSSFYIGKSVLSGNLQAFPSRDYRYSDAKNVTLTPSEVSQILQSLGQTINPADLPRIQDQLKGATFLTGIGDDPIGNYLRALSVFVNDLNEIDGRLERTRAFIFDGDVNNARTEVARLNDLRFRTATDLKTTYSLLAELKNYYGVDTSLQLVKVKQLGTLFQSYSAQIDELSTKVSPQQELIQTFLTLNASKTEVLTGEPFLLFGVLHLGNGTALPSRDVTITWDPNHKIVRTTDFSGKFNASISFSPGFPAGLTRIGVDFVPKGADQGVYLPITAFELIRIGYISTAIVAAVSPSIVKPLDLVDVTGTLTTVDGKPVANRTITVALDGGFLGNVTTGIVGDFNYRFVVLQSLVNGTHTLDVAFKPTAAQFLPSNITLQFRVELLKTQIQFQTDSSWIFSGTNLTLTGNVADVNGTRLDSGSIAVFVDNIKSDSRALDGNGSFVSSIKLPLEFAYGTHTVSIEYQPDLPWLQASSAKIHFFVYNTPLTIALAVAIPIGSSSIAYIAVRRKKTATARLITVPQAARAEVAPTGREFTPVRLTSVIQAEAADPAKIRKAYALAQAMINQKIRQPSRDSETPWEYFSRVIKLVPSTASPLQRVIELFELAEYSPYPVEKTHSEEATRVLLALREKIEV